MRKVIELSDFDNGQMVMARQLETLISETVRLVDCSSVVVVITYRKWYMDDERQMPGQQYVAHDALILKESGHGYALFVMTEELLQT